MSDSLFRLQFCRYKTALILYFKFLSDLPIDYFQLSLKIHFPNLCLSIYNYMTSQSCRIQDHNLGSFVDKNEQLCQASAAF